MNRSTLRWAMIVLTLITAAVHLFLGITSVSDPAYQTMGILFILNAIGYVVLLLGALGKIPFLPVRLSHYLLIAFAAVTLAAYFVINQLNNIMNPADLIAKLSEVLLIVATFMHVSAAQSEAA
jgi:hypothetical protein